MDGYEVAVDLPRRLLVLTLQGHWDEGTFDKFADEYSTAMAMLRRHGGCRCVLVDGQKFSAQAPEISERFKWLSPIASHRTATVVPAQLDELAADQAGDEIDARIFTSRKDALRWLFPEQYEQMEQENLD